MLRRLPAVQLGPSILGSSLSRMMDELFRDVDEVGFGCSPSFGRTDVYERDKTLVFEMELPGTKKDAISIKVEEDKLSISGEVKLNEEIERENYFHLGRQYGRFQRCFSLPADLIDKAAITARFEDGILVVTAPLKESLKEKEKPIEIEVG